MFYHRTDLDSEESSFLKLSVKAFRPLLAFSVMWLSPPMKPVIVWLMSLKMDSNEVVHTVSWSFNSTGFPLIYTTMRTLKYISVTYRPETEIRRCRPRDDDDNNNN